LRVLDLGAGRRLPVGENVAVDRAAGVLAGGIQGTHNV
jgi:hypothetical protein